MWWMSVRISGVFARFSQGENSAGHCSRNFPFRERWRRGVRVEPFVLENTSQQYHLDITFLFRCRIDVIHKKHMEVLFFWRH